MIGAALFFLAAGLEYKPGVYSVAAPKESQAVADCYVARIEQLDDGVSDPLSIARVVVPLCEKQIAAYLRATFPEASQGLLDEALPGRIAHETKTAAAGVLLYRKARKGR